MNLASRPLAPKSAWRQWDHGLASCHLRIVRAL